MVDPEHAALKAELEGLRGLVERDHGLISEISASVKTLSDNISANREYDHREELDHVSRLTALESKTKATADALDAHVHQDGVSSSNTIAWIALVVGAIASILGGLAAGHLL